MRSGVRASTVELIDGVWGYASATGCALVGQKGARKTDPTINHLPAFGISPAVAWGIGAVHSSTITIHTRRGQLKSCSQEAAWTENPGLSSPGHPTEFKWMRQNRYRASAYALIGQIIDIFDVPKDVEAGRGRDSERFLLSVRKTPPRTGVALNDTFGHRKISSLAMISPAGHGPKQNARARCDLTQPSCCQ